MAYRFAPASNPYVEVSGGDLVGDNLCNTSSGGWTVAVGLKRSGVGAWQCLGLQHDTVTENLFLLEFNPSNQLVVGDASALSASSSATNNSTTANIIVAYTWDGTDNVANNARFSIHNGTSWTHNLVTHNSSESSFPFAGVDTDTRFKIGNNLTNGDDFNGDIYVWGVRLGGRSQAQIEALSLGASGYATWQTMFDVADSILLKFDSLSTLTDQANGTANETARSAAGISLVSDPTNFYSAGGTDATVVAVPADAVASALTHAVTGGSASNPVSPAADAAGSVPVPVVSASSTVTAVPATAVASAPLSGNEVSVDVSAVPATARAATLTHSTGSTSGATVTAVPATAVSSARTHALSASSEVVSSPADAIAAPTAPSVSGELAALVQAVPASAFGYSTAPLVSDGTVTTNPVRWVVTVPKHPEIPTLSDRDD
jgi:hypothetical protein